MEYLEITGNKSLMEAVERANNICLEPIICHWDGTLFHNDLGLHDVNTNKVDDLRFKLGFDHVELIDSSMEEKQSSMLIFTTGNLKTLTMTFFFKLSDTKINGKIRICSVLNQSLNSSYKLHLAKIKVKSTVGLYIAEDSYRVDHVIHEFTDASISLMYKNGSKMIPVYNKVQATHIRHSLVQYIISNYTKNTITMIEDKLRSAFDLTSVSISLNGSFSLRDLFRSHTKKMKTAFDKLADEIIDTTNQLLMEKVHKIPLPNISVVLNFKRDEKKSFQACKSFLMGTNFLFRKKSTAISLEDDLVVLYIPVDFALLNIQYKQLSVKYGDEEYRSSDVQEHYKTEGSYITISLRKLAKNKVDLNLLEFKIVNFIFLDSDNQVHIDSAIRAWVNNIVEFSIVPVIEEIYEKYLRLAMEHEKFTTLACCATS